MIMILRVHSYASCIINLNPIERFDEGKSNVVLKQSEMKNKENVMAHVCQALQRNKDGL